MTTGKDRDEIVKLIGRKFTVLERDDEYEISHISEDSVTITWGGNFSNYNIPQVLDFIKNEKWILIPEKSTLSVNDGTTTTNIIKNKTMEILKTLELEINGKSRDVTLFGTFTGNFVNVGYSVRRPIDKENPKLAKTIAKGRALSPKTNLTEGMSVTNTTRKKYILDAILERVAKEIEWGVIEIKGVK